MSNQSETKNAHDKRTTFVDKMDIDALQGFIGRNLTQLLGVSMMIPNQEVEKVVLVTRVAFSRLREKIDELQTKSEQ